MHKHVANFRLCWSSRSHSLAIRADEAAVALDVRGAQLRIGAILGRLERGLVALNEQRLHRLQHRWVRLGQIRVFAGVFLDVEAGNRMVQPWNDTAA